MLDERLSLAASLYEPCRLGADIGTDHALLPCYLLEQGICDRMILADVSPNAMNHAREQVTRRRLNDRAILRCADGFDAIKGEQCGCVSAMGMGGETLAGILLNGQQLLQGAVLVLSAHTDPQLTRHAIHDIGYHIVREELCRAAGRFYIMWRAEPGIDEPAEEDYLYGRLLYEKPSPLLTAYLARRIQVLESKERGLLSGMQQDAAELEAAQRDLAFYRRKAKECQL